MNTQFFDFGRVICWFVFLVFVLFALSYHSDVVSAELICKQQCSQTLGGSPTQDQFFEMYAPSINNRVITLTPKYVHADRKYPVTWRVKFWNEQVSAWYSIDAPSESDEAQTLTIPDNITLPTKIQVAVRAPVLDGTVDFSDCKKNFGLTLAFAPGDIVVQSSGMASGFMPASKPPPPLEPDLTPESSRDWAVGDPLTQQEPESDLTPESSRDWAVGVPLTQQEPEQDLTPESSRDWAVGVPLTQQEPEQEPEPDLTPESSRDWAVGVPLTQQEPETAMSAPKACYLSEPPT